MSALIGKNVTSLNDRLLTELAELDFDALEDLPVVADEVHLVHADGEVRDAEQDAMYA